MKKIFSAFVVIMAFAFLLVGCTAGLVLPASDARVKGNGGFVVQKGEYVYFANGYIETSSLGTLAENDGSSKEYSIYRVKTSDYLNGAMTYDEDGYPENVEKIADKIAGFENSGMFIVGDYLFFGSPNVHKTNRNEDRFDLVTIFSVKLDGSSFKELYTTADYTDGDFSIVEVNQTNYLLTFEGDKIIRQTISEGRISNKVNLAENVTSTILVDEIQSSFDHDIYFTTDRSETDQELGLTGNILKKVNIASANITSFENPVGQTVTLVSQTNSKLVYKSKTTNDTESLFVKSLTGADQQLSYWAGEQVFFLGYEIDNSLKPMVYVSQNKLLMQEIGSLQTEILVDANVTILFTSGDYVYYSTEEGISRISYKDKVVQAVSTTANTSEFDFDGRYIYVFTTVTDSIVQVKYIHRVDTYAVDQNAAQDLKLVGYVLPEHRPSEE